MRLKPFVILAALFLLLPWSRSSVKAANPAYGIVTQNYDSVFHGKVLELGAGTIRIGLNWYDIEPMQDVWRPWHRGLHERRQRANRGPRDLAQRNWTSGLLGQLPSTRGQPVCEHVRDHPLEQLDKDDAVRALHWAILRRVHRPARLEQSARIRRVPRLDHHALSDWSGLLSRLGLRPSVRPQ